MLSSARDSFVDFSTTYIAHPIESAWTTVNNRLAQTHPAIVVVGTAVGTYYALRLTKIYRRGSEQPLFKRLKAYGFSWLRLLPSVHHQIDMELARARVDIEHSIFENDLVDLSYILTLPDDPISDEQLLARLDSYCASNVKKFDPSTGRVSGAVYTNVADEAHMAVLSETFQRFAFSNPLHPDVFPGVRRMEAEIIRMVANLFHGPPEACGTVTSGGTESIMLACLGARNRALARGITEPVFVVPVTAHAAFDKAAEMLGVQVRHVSVFQKDGRVDVCAMKRAICSRTCLLVGSAPNFPTGTVDHIPAIAALGEKYGIPVHVDACLGGFIVAFAEQIGLRSVPCFDFRLAGVTSISCDTHKYGYAPKGTSTLIYRSPELLHHQYFCAPEWPGGIYATQTLAGSRSGLAIALTWTTLVHIGRDEYIRRAQAITSKTRQLADAIHKVSGLTLLGSPDVSVVAFRSDRFNIHAVSDALNRRGWNLNSLQNPDAIHFTLTNIHAERPTFLAEFMTDLLAACEEVETMPDKGQGSKTAALYGMTAKLSDKSLVNEFAAIYLDACQAVPKHQNDTIKK